MKPKNRIKEILDNKLISVSYLAMKLDMDENTLNDIINGDENEVTLKEARMISYALLCRMDYIWSEY